MCDQEGAPRLLGHQAGFAPVDSLDLRSLSNRANAASNESWSFQFEKSGMKYSRISTVRSLPTSASKYFQGADGFKVN